MTAIFISHSSADRIAAKDMKRWLEAQGHTSVFLDFDVESGIKGGSDWEQTLYHKLRQCQAVIALLTPDWIASKWCFAELVQARERGKAIFLVKVQPCETREIFADIQHIDLTTQPEEGYQRLKAGLLEHGLDPLDVFDWDPQRPPYPGFMAFQEADAAIFFGRGLDIIKTLETLEALRRQGREAPPLALLLGASGSGKSSLARAGVIPRLRKQPADWLPVPPFRPQLEPIDELAMSLAAAFQAQRQPRDWRSIRAELEQATQQQADGQVLVNLARDLALAAGQPEATVLLTIDQAEELFGYTGSEPATRFLRLLRAGLETADRRLMAIATLRSDFLADFQNHPVLQDSDYPHHFRYRAVPVDPMLLGSFAEIIQGPAQLAGLQLADGLVETMVADTGTRDALPLLAFALRRLYERYGSDGRLTVAEYEDLGRLDGAVREEAQDILEEANPTPEQREALHAAFVPALVRINAEGGYARRRAVLNTLPPAAVPLLRRFVDGRLLVTDRDADGRETIEVAHEALLRTWPQLAGWLAEDRDKLRLLESLQRAAEEWELGGRRDDLLAHRGTRLEDVEALAATPRFGLPDGSTEWQYLSACRAAESAREAAEKEERDRRIRDAQDRQEAAEKLAAAETAGKEEAEARAREAQAHAAVLRKRSRILRAVLAATTIIAIIAVFAFVQANRAQHRATREARDALAAQLDTEASAVFSRVTAAGSDIRALADTLAAQRLRSDPTASRGAFYTATTALNTTRVIVPTPAPVPGVAVSPDGHTLASGSDDHTIRLWNLTDPAHPVPLGPPLTGHTDAVASVAFSLDGHTLASGGWDDTVRLWNLTDPAHPIPLGPALTGHTGAVHGVAFNPDGHTLASGGLDGTVRLWDLTDPAHPVPLGPPLTGHTNAVIGVTFSPDGHTLASASLDATIRLWDLTDPAHPGPLGPPLTGTDEVYSLAFSPDGHTLASGSLDATIRLWNLTDPAHPGPLGPPLTGHTKTVVTVAFSPDGHTLASASADHTIRLWDLTDPAHPGPLGPPLQGHTGLVRSVAFSPDGHTLASGSDDHTIRLWNLDTALPLRGHTGAVVGVAFSPDGHILASGGADSTVRLWNLIDPAHPGPLGPPLTGHTDAVASVAFSPDGHTLASGSGDDTVRLWNLTDSAHPGPLGPALTGHTGEVDSVAFSTDGHTLASGGLDGTVRLWDLTDPAHPVPLGPPLTGHTNAVVSVAFSPDGHTLASGGWDGTVRLWDLTDPAHPGPLGPPLHGHTGGVVSVAFSPDGHTLASGSLDATVRLWNLTDPAHPIALGQPLTGHTNTVDSVAFGPDGHTLASGSADQTVRLWNLTDPAHPIALGQPLTGHTNTVDSVAFGPNGHTLASGSLDTTVRLWPTPLDATVATLCSKLTSNISHHDWHDWISPTIGYITLCPNLPVPQN